MHAGTCTTRGPPLSAVNSRAHWFCFVVGDSEGLYIYRAPSLSLYSNPDTKGVKVMLLLVPQKRVSFFVMIG